MTAPPFTLPADCPAVYHLLRGGEVVYVGQSIIVWNRLSSWLSATRPPRQWTNGLTFDSFRIKPTALEHLRAAELADIAALQPPFNRQGLCQSPRGPFRDAAP